MRGLAFALGLALLALAGCVKAPPMEPPPKMDPVPAPEFTATSLSGEEMTLKKLEGRPVIVNFWATWCLPCVEEMPELEKFYFRKKADGLALLMINLKENKDLVKRWIGSNGFTFDVYLDETGKLSEDFGIIGLPYTFFIDKKGVIQRKHMGKLTPEILFTGFEEINGR